MEDKDYLRIVNTILAVYRIDIVLTSIEELVPSLWVVLLELHFQKLQANQVHINHVEIPPGSSDVEMVKWVVKGLELIAGFDLEHLDCAGITRIEMKYVKPLVELFWELFKALDASVSIESVANIDVEADIETITKTDEKSIQVDIDDKLDETTRSNMTSQSQTKRKKLNPLNLSAEEMREYGLEPIKSDGEGRPSGDQRLAGGKWRTLSPRVRSACRGRCQ